MNWLDWTLVGLWVFTLFLMFLVIVSGQNLMEKKWQKPGGIFWSILVPAAMGVLIYYVNNGELTWFGWSLILWYGWATVEQIIVRLKGGRWYIPAVFVAIAIVFLILNLIFMFTVGVGK